MSYDDGLMIPERAQEYLSQRLRNGTLILFLGSGITQGLGLPSWIALTNQLRNKVGLGPISLSSGASQLQIAVDDVRRKCKDFSTYKELIKSSLYEGMPSLSYDILKNDLFIALGGLLMGSKRGNIPRLVTLNLDSMLEWFLSLYGFTVRVVHKLPELEGSEDVRIYHPHGFLPHPSLGRRDSDFAILDLQSVYDRLGNIADLWSEMVRHLLRSGICLFVGLSEQTFLDPSLGPWLTTIGKEVLDKRVLGLWLTIDKISIREKFLETNVPPIEFSSPKALADFLLGICQKSASSLFL
jgi:hypothetical protein